MAQNGVPAEKYCVYWEELTAKGVSLCNYHMLMRQVLVHLIKPKIPQAIMQA